MAPGRVNFLYFGFLFFCGALLHASHALLIDTSAGQQFAFLVDATLQCLFEVALLLLIGELVMRWLPKSAFFAFVGLTFLLLIARVIDFFLVRLMDLTVWNAFGLMREESLKNFIEMLQATNVPLSVWALMGIGVLVLPLLGICLFLFLQKYHRQITFPFKMHMVTFASAFLLLLTWDFCRGLPVDFSTYDKFRKILPFKATLSTPKTEKITVCKRALSEEWNDEAESLKTLAPRAVLKPDIYLFIVESLREDFLTKEVAPFLFDFKSENITCPLTLSSANATHLSWFSIFTSKLPLFWSEHLNQRRKWGSMPIKLLKEMGYSISVYSSTRLSFYGMDEKIFGEGSSLADRTFFSYGKEIPAFASDERTVIKLMEEMSEDSGNGRVHIVFLEGTHFDYSWPKESGTHFFPVQEEIDYLKAVYSKEELEGIKNRYRNAIHHIDSLFGRFLQKLNETQKGKESLVVFTGDHGEEFYEEGHLFHASSLNAPQTQVPIYYKFGDKSHIPATSLCGLTSHVDIFPTLFHYIFQNATTLSSMHGESIFKEKRWSYAVSTRYNAGRNPTEFLIHNGKQKILFRDEEDSQEISILSIKDRYDRNLTENRAQVKEELTSALQRLFPNNP
ncbi:MAG: sulfatase-like hydrolase/transferase [Chlamydiales bacterium]